MRTKDLPSKALKHLVVLTCSLLAAGSLAACGNSTSATSTTSPVSNATTTSGPRVITIPAKPSTQRQRPASPSRFSSQAASRGVEGFRVAHGDNSALEFGQQASIAQQQNAATALAAFMWARARGQWAQMCPYIARATLRPLQALTKAPCGSALARLITSSRSERADIITHGIAGMRVKANTAFVFFYGPKSEKFLMPMRSEHGAWKVTQLTPLAYPIGAPATP